MKMVLGIDIGGTNVAFGLVDNTGKVVHRGIVSTQSVPMPQQLVDQLHEIVLPILQKHAIVLKGIGIGAPNGNYYKGTIEFAPNLKWEGIVPLREMFAQKFNVPCALTNDANAAAMGELKYGGAQRMKDFIFLTLGTGVGSGVVVDGKIVYGHDGFAGELGHVIVEKNGRLCGCGRKGCIETYCNASGIVKTYVELSGNTAVITSKEVADRATAGDAKAIEAFKITACYLSLFLANSVAYTSPEAIFIYGGPAGAGNFLFEPLKDMFEEHLLKIYKGKIKILQSQLPDNDAAILGAASLI